MFKVTFPYQPDKKYSQKVAYFSMEFAIDQALKTYAGGLGFLVWLTYEGCLSEASKHHRHRHFVGLRLLRPNPEIQQRYGRAVSRKIL